MRRRLVMMSREDSNKFAHMFSKGKIGKYETPNRVKWAACCVSNFNNRDGSYTEREYARDEIIGKMGCGIYTNQGAYPDKKGEGKGYYSQICLNDDKFIPGIKRVADIFHKGSGIAIQQILHAARYGGIDLGYCVQPSAVPQTLRHFRPPREMTKDEIHQAIQDHVDAAVRAKKAGFEGVEITSFLGYLLAVFLSPFTNRRTDEYGGSVEKRARLMVEIIEGIKKACGEDFIVSTRLNGSELMDEYGGSSEEECIEYMKIAEAVGVDLISMVLGWHESRTGALGRDVPHDNWLYLAKNAKKCLKVPLSFGPRLADPLLAEKALAEGIIDFWEICRPGLADPQVVQKTKEGRLGDIKPCIGDLMCLASLFANQPYICTVNPRLGHEMEPEYEVKPAVRSKKVVVIGGGLSGLECAVTAAQRGHSVVIYEKRDKLGGQVLSAAREVQGGDNLLALLQYYENQIGKLNIGVHLGTEADADICTEEDPDVVVLATGAYIEKPDIPGIGKEAVVTAFEVLEKGKEVTNKRFVVVEGGKVGLIAAEFLASQGNEVVVVTKEKRVDFDVSATFRWRHKAWVKEFGINVLTQSKVLRIENNNEVIVSNTEGDQTSIDADVVVVAGPRKADQKLFELLEMRTNEIYMVGDSIKPRSMNNAIHEGFRLGVRI
jgi:2,4-dienoyl-CoA reductase (NADPH2)